MVGCSFKLLQCKVWSLMGEKEKKNYKRITTTKKDLDLGIVQRAAVEILSLVCQCALISFLGGRVQRAAQGMLPRSLVTVPWFVSWWAGSESERSPKSTISLAEHTLCLGSFGDGQRSERCPKSSLMHWTFTVVPFLVERCSKCSLTDWTFFVPWFLSWCAEVRERDVQKVVSLAEHSLWHSSLLGGQSAESSQGSSGGSSTTSPWATQSWHPAVCQDWATRIQRSVWVCFALLAVGLPAVCCWRQHISYHGKQHRIFCESKIIKADESV